MGNKTQLDRICELEVLVRELSWRVSILESKVEESKPGKEIGQALGRGINRGVRKGK